MALGAMKAVRSQNGRALLVPKEPNIMTTGGHPSKYYKGTQNLFAIAPVGESKHGVELISVISQLRF